MGYKAQWFFRDEAIHVVCRVSEKPLQRSRWDFLRRHQSFNRMEIDKMFNTDLNTPKSEIEERIKKLQQQLVENNIDAALILQKVDLFYFAGTIQDAHLYVPADKDPILMVYKDFKRARAESLIKNIVPLENVRQICSLLHDNWVQTATYSWHGTRCPSYQFIF